ARDYTKWDHHGECDDNTDNSEDEIEDEMEKDDMLGMLDDIRQHLDGGLPMDEPEDPNEAAKTFFKLVSEADKPFLKKLKRYVGNKARPEGFIVETYLVDECLTFCSRYLTGVETLFNLPERNDDHNSSSMKPQPSVVSPIGRHLRSQEVKVLDANLWKVAVIYVLENCDELLEFSRSQRCTKMVSENLNQYLLSLARGSDKRVTYLSSYYINGFRFHTKAREQTKRCQNSGVMVRGENNGGISFYGTLSNVIELRYTDGVRVVLFQCEWYDTTREGIGYKKDHHGIISVNTKRKLKTEEPDNKEWVVISKIINLPILIPGLLDVMRWYLDEDGFPKRGLTTKSELDSLLKNLESIKDWTPSEADDFDNVFDETLLPLPIQRSSEDKQSQEIYATDQTKQNPRSESNEEFKVRPSFWIRQLFNTIDCSIHQVIC
ncbi:hypothetical protein LINGRAHAP2_LOCUS27976, partial [Linum grandiflorum]